MRIYGGKDYYDSAMAFGQDPATVLVRSTTKSFERKEIPLDVPVLLDLNLSGRDYISTYWIIVVFCDKVYRGLKVSMCGADHFFWNIEKLQEWAAENRVSISRFRSWAFYKYKKLTVETCMDVLPVSKDLREFMLKQRLAILLDLDPGRNVPGLPIQANPPNLKQFGFAKAVDPFTAYQELSMWISGVLGGASPDISQITDDQILLENHGYDKHSFRSSVRD